VCEYLQRRSPDRFAGLPEAEEFVSTQGNPRFSRDAESFRMALRLPNGLWAEGNLSANDLRDMMKRLLDHFEIPQAALRLYLRQDRDAGRGDECPA